jgi:hypothetical protein
MRHMIAFALFAASCTTNIYQAPAADMTGADLSSPADLAHASPADLAAPPDLSAPADMAEAAVDMFPQCGAAEGQSCCGHVGSAPTCEDRDRLTGQYLVCNSGACAKCGVHASLCCRFDVCYGGTSCKFDGTCS